MTKTVILPNCFKCFFTKCYRSIVTPNNTISNYVMITIYKHEPMHLIRNANGANISRIKSTCCICF